MSDQLDQWDASWHRRTPNVGRRVVRALLVDLTMLLTCLAILEAALSWSGYHGVESVDVGRNEQGYRESCLVGKKPPGQFRLLVEGDSVAFGTGVRLDSTFAKQLQSLLLAKTPHSDVLVVNAGRESSSLLQVLHNLEEHCDRIQPDAVVLTLSPTLLATQSIEQSKDVGKDEAQDETNRTGRLAVAAKLALLRGHVWLHGHFRSYQFLQNEIRLPLYQLGIMEERLDKVKGALFAYDFDVGADSCSRSRAIENAYRGAEDCLRRIHEMLQRRGIDLCAVTVPSQFTVSDLRADNPRRVDKSKARIAPEQRFRELVRRHHIALVEALPALVVRRQRMIQTSGNWEPMFIRNDYTHLDRHGHRVVAELLCEHFRKSECFVRAAQSSNAARR